MRPWRGALMLARRLAFFLAIFLAIFNLQAAAANHALIVQLSPIANLSTVTSLLGGTVIDSIPEAGLYLLSVPNIPLLQSIPLLGINWMELDRGIAQPSIP